MSSVIAINVQANETRLVAAECELGRPLRLKSYFKIPVPQKQTSRTSPEESLEIPNSNEKNLEQEINESAPSIVLSESEEAELKRILSTEFDTCYGVISLGAPLYSKQELPFSDQKKIEQVAALQIQDLLPFDTDNFLIDSFSTGAQEKGQNVVLSAAVSRESVSTAGTRFLDLRQDVRTVTTMASSLSALGSFVFSQNARGLRALVGFFPGAIALVVFKDSTPVYLREFEQGETDSLMAVHLNCSLARVSRDSNTAISKVHILGNDSQFQSLKAELKYPSSRFDVGDLIVQDPTLEIPIKVEDISWALGLLIPESRKGRKKPLLDFGQGQFKFIKGFKTLWGLLQDEIVYIALAAGLGLALISGKYYTSYLKVSSIESAIKSKLKEAFPGESIPLRAELSFVADKLEQERSQLKGLGTPNSISPLEALREFSLASKPLSNLSIDSLSITSDLLSVRGSLAENRELNDLSSILNSNPGRLCKAKVDNRGRSVGGSRVEFIAEISICPKSEKNQ